MAYNAQLYTPYGSPQAYQFANQGVQQYQVPTNGLVRVKGRKGADAASTSLGRPVCVMGRCHAVKGGFTA